MLDCSFLVFPSKKYQQENVVHSCKVLFFVVVLVDVLISYVISTTSSSHLGLLLADGNPKSKKGRVLNDSSTIQKGQILISLLWVGSNLAYNFSFNSMGKICSIQLLMASDDYDAKELAVEASMSIQGSMMSKGLRKVSKN